MGDGIVMDIQNTAMQPNAFTGLPLGEVGAIGLDEGVVVVKGTQHTAGCATRRLRHHIDHGGDTHDIGEQAKFIALVVGNLRGSSEKL